MLFRSQGMDVAVGRAEQVVLLDQAARAVDEGVAEAFMLLTLLLRDSANNVLANRRLCFGPLYTFRVTSYSWLPGVMTLPRSFADRSLYASSRIKVSDSLFHIMSHEHRLNAFVRTATCHDAPVHFGVRVIGIRQDTYAAIRKTGNCTLV